MRFPERKLVPRLLAKENALDFLYFTRDNFTRDSATATATDACFTFVHLLTLFHFEFAARMSFCPPHRLGVFGRKVAELGVARRERYPNERDRLAKTQ